MVPRRVHREDAKASEVEQRSAACPPYPRPRLLFTTHVRHYGGRMTVERGTAVLERRLDQPAGAAAGDHARVAVTVTEVAAPLGRMLLGAADGRLCLAEFIDESGRLGVALERLRDRRGWQFGADQAAAADRAVLDDAAAQLTEYFAGTRATFSLPLWAPGTALQEQVWRELQRIPCGQTSTYGEVATAIGRPRAARPVGRAIGDNRLAIVIPCHRVVGSGGRLTGYGGGLWRKRHLLELEHPNR